MPGLVKWFIGGVIPVVLLGVVVVGFSIVKSQKMEVLVWGQNKIYVQSGTFTPEAEAVWNGQTIAALASPLSGPSEQLLTEVKILGETAGAEKWIEIDLANQRLRAYQDDRVIYEFPVSSGKFVETPVGEYRIWSKFKYTKMEGGVKGTGTYYYLPNVPYTMFFYKGFGIHGTYWHNNFGQPMSHGCVNLSIPDAEKLFYWADPPIEPAANSMRANQEAPGTKVVVHGKTPRTY